MRMEDLKQGMLFREGNRALMIYKLDSQLRGWWADPMASDEDIKKEMDENIVMKEGWPIENDSTVTAWLPNMPVPTMLVKTMNSFAALKKAGAKAAEMRA